jgi:dihydrofolate reductase
LSLPARAFQNRICFVLTKNHCIDPSIAIPVQSLSDLEIKYAAHPDLIKKKHFVIGGAIVYDFFFRAGQIDVALITHIRKPYDGDTFFPLQHITSWHCQMILDCSEFWIRRYTKKEGRLADPLLSYPCHPAG